ncbi:trigger factor [Candidatus Uabimicrobium sp. HlEnr_7]|uniref:trigger factor n=1 Tax=Candidatus Uabimicrobium helgolandensis TaxID=3095367 RepID=UPI0035571FC7
MEITITDIGPSHKSIKLSKSIDNVKKDYNSKIAEIRKEAVIPGFRPGKTPQRIIEKRFANSILDELKRNYLLEGFESLTKEHNIRPLEEPKIDPDKITLEKDKEFVFEVEMETHPQIELKEEDYKGLTAEREEVEISDEELNKVLDQIRERKSEWAPLEKGKSEEKDFLICDVELLCDEESIYKKEGVNVSVEHPFVAGIKLADEDLTGHSIDDTVNKDITIPDDFEQEDHRGKKSKLTIKIVEIKRMQLPELNDEFAKEMDTESVDDLKEKITNEIKGNKEQQLNSKIEHDLIHQLGESTKIEIPEAFLQKQVDAAIEEEKRKLSREEDKSEENKSDEDAAQEIDEEKIRHDAIHQLREIFLINHIAEQQKIEVSRREVDDYINQMAQYQGGGQWPHELRKMFEQQGMLDEIYGQLKNQKVLAFLRENAKVEVKEAKKDSKKEDSKNKKSSDEKSKKKDTAKKKNKK